MEGEVGIFDYSYLEIGILVNQSGANVMTEESLLNRYRAASIGNSDLGTDSEILHRSLYQIFRSGWAIDVDGLGPLVVPCGRHKCAKAGSVVVMMMRDENGAHISNVETSLGDAASHAIAGVNDIKRVIDNQQI